MSLLLVLALIGLGIYIAKHANQAQPATSGVRAPNTVDYSPAKPSDITGSTTQKGHAPTNPTQPSQPVASFSVVVTRASVDTQNRQLIVGTLVDGTAGGTCQLRLTQTGQPDVTAESQVQLQTNSYACQNFVVPFSQFPGGGSWRASVTVTNNGSSASASWSNPIDIPK